jgi:multiple sugar transport system permease protein
MSTVTAASQLVRRTPPRSVRRRRFLIAVAEHSLLIAAAIAFLAPFVFITLTALMTNNQALSSNLWPHPFAWHNFVTVFTKAPLWRWTLNTLEYAVLATVGVILSSVPVAYALARLRWRGRGAAFMVVLVALMLPPQVTVVPLYVMWAKLHLIGTLWPVIIPNWLGDAFSIFLLRQFMLTVPREYLDAAKVDGCSDLSVLLRIVLPMTRPAIAAVGLFQFFYCWNDYFGPQIYTSENPAAWTLSYGLQSFKSAHHTNWNLTMAATVMVMAPVILLFFFAQKAFIEGVTLTGVKG